MFRLNQSSSLGPVTSRWMDIIKLIGDFQFFKDVSRDQVL